MNIPIEAIIKKNISNENIKYYSKNGFLIAESLFDKSDIYSLIDESIKILRSEKGSFKGVLSHYDKSNLEVLSQYSAIHFPHKMSKLIKKYASDSRIASVLSKVVSANVKCMQTMLFIKGPGKLGQSWHQDEYFIPTRDKSLIGAWIAIDDATVENGCLWVIPESQIEGVILRRKKNTNQNFADEDICDLKKFKEENAIPVEVKSGSVVFFNGYLQHMSLKNKTKSSYRKALVCHYMSAESMLPWNVGGRINSTEDMRDIFMVAGSDPYDYKGVEDLIKPFVRPVNVTDNN
jgi:ectoine hydroxylase-related dioxygenase (phytanoyl-CoA dioxygenase family)